MANFAIITAERIVNNSTVTCTYMGNIQGDGWIYFNDETFWRCTSNRYSAFFQGYRVERMYLNKCVWVPTGELTIVSVTQFNATQAQNVINGGGGVAPNAKVEDAVKWAINKVNNEYITYSQIIRNLKNPNGSSYDCSSFIITAFYVGGFNADATYTGNMKRAFLDLGFIWIPGSYFSADECIRGDILLNEVEHTQMYIGNNQDVNCGSTPARITSHSPDNWGSNWDGILRYPR